MNSKAMAQIDEFSNKDDEFVYQGKISKNLLSKTLFLGPILKPEFSEKQKAKNKNFCYRFCYRCGESNLNRTNAKGKLKRKKSIGGRARSGAGLYKKSDVDDEEEFKAQHTHCHKKCINCGQIFTDIEEKI